MQIEEIKAKTVNDIIPPVVLRVGMGKDEAVPAYICGFTTYETPCGEMKETAILSDNKVKDTVTGSKPIVYRLYSQLLRDYKSVIKIGSKTAAIEQI